ncbi:type I-U CRISPR-associated protein Cas7 [Bremerella cremea]|uniref:Type I-U CRISPR-associated protein Cas7 n=1 Tax=Bremerella cremea TaxID=1031537 RepID=A0A368KZ52_9BACT|nr:type I-U CRISPR-associated RAMP protein Csb1/Cas7u [Bremerella cremea]RCS55775.1 type I-U CRISPR-associated protein Cas7 [Bremerella cremea]
MSVKLDQFDSWLTGRQGPAAVVLREYLIPVEGEDGVLFPPTFAAGDGFSGGYNIDPPPTKDQAWQDENVCLIDSVGSQANRIEPIFKEEPYDTLVPQVVVEAGDHRVNLLDAGHRAGDALVRCSELADQVNEAFRAVERGDYSNLASFAPTSLVFGAWNSRGEKGAQSKVPRLISSTIRAFNVLPLTRGAQYIPAIEYVDKGWLDEPKDKKTKDAYAAQGFVHVPASASHGGVIAKGGVRRDATLSLAALQHIKAGDNTEQTLMLRRYVLGLSLVALTAEPDPYLRQGCNLVINPEKPTECCEVYRSGERKPFKLSHEDAIAFAQLAAEAFGVGENQTVAFDKKKAKADMKK